MAKANLVIAGMDACLNFLKENCKEVKVPQSVPSNKAEVHAFYGGALSNFSECSFQMFNIQFDSREKAYIFGKVCFSEDIPTVWKLISEAQTPMACKKLGRKVNWMKGVVEWRSVCFGWMVYLAVVAGQQDQDFRAALLKTGFKYLVEASPIDDVWGIGESVSDVKNCSENSEKWRDMLQAMRTGNLMGKALMAARTKLLEQFGGTSPSHKRTFQEAWGEGHDEGQKKRRV
jgi:hypothetical protein